MSSVQQAPLSMRRIKKPKMIKLPDFRAIGSKVRLVRPLIFIQNFQVYILLSNTIAHNN